MATKTDSQSETGLLSPTEVTDLLVQFLAKIPVNPNSIANRSNGAGADTILGIVDRDGLRFTLTCSPCPKECATSIVLSPREKEIVRLVMKGISTRGIAQLLEISPWTVSTHLRRIFLKLGVSSRPEMVAQVLREGVLAVGA